jgi:hypothetical protein
MRAESAEEELRQLKATIRLSASKLETLMDSPKSQLPPPPPPPPPPMPSFTLNSHLNTNNIIRSRSNSQTLSDAISGAQYKLQHSQNESKETKIATGRKIDLIPFSHSPAFSFTSLYVSIRLFIH